MRPDFVEIVKHFRFEGDFLEVNLWKFGHINDTYIARFRKGDGAVHRYVLQRINHHVFKSPEKLMHNIDTHFPQVKDYMSEMTPYAVQGMTYNVHIYGLPYYADTIIFVYNEEHRKEAGFDEPPLLPGRN